MSSGRLLNYLPVTSAHAPQHTNPEEVLSYSAIAGSVEEQLHLRVSFDAHLPHISI